MVMKMMSLSKLPSLAALLFFVLFSFFKLSCCIVNMCPDIEKQSLLSFKQSLQDPENELSSWNADEVNCCKWERVLCSNLTGHVQQLDLSETYLRGQINPSLLNLKHLKYLDLSGNHFNKTIPSFIGSLTSLEYLDLSSAQFHGKIPPTIGNLSNLHTLSLEARYSLEGDSLEWLSRLSKLEYLNMNGVNLSRASDWQQQVINILPYSLVELHFRECSLNFTGLLSDVNNNNITTSDLAILDLSAQDSYVPTSANIVPRWIFRLGNLIYLDVSINDYEGPIPTISNSTKLQHIDLSSNNFNSSIPEWLYFLTDLDSLSLRRNNIQGAVSNSITNLTSLSDLDLSNNKLSGKLPRGLVTNLCKLQKLDLSRNKLQGGVSDIFGNVSDCWLGSLESLVLSDNQLSGPLSHHQFGEFKSLRYLSIKNNSLSGVIPSNIGSLSSLEYLYMGDNKFTGNLPESIGQLSNLMHLDIENNTLEGVVTETHFSHLSRLHYLYASENNLTLKVNPNWIPPFKIRALALGSWNLGSPTIPRWLDTQKTSLDYLDLSNTGMYGNVPNWLWSMWVLNLSHNHLHGKISLVSDSPWISRKYQLLYLGSNNFSGELPQVKKWLIDLDLSNNSFSGYLSHVLCNRWTYSLENLQLDGNHLTGELPDCFMNLSSLVILNLGNNNLSGRIPYSIGFLTSLKSLNLHGNNFSGDIPFSMHNCTELLKIDLSHNKFSGNLPKQIVTSLSKLMILILKSNKLSGEITSAICQLTSLQILDLSDNMFYGMIPRCVNNFTAMITAKRSSYRDSYSRFTGREHASIATKGRELTYDDNTLFLVTSIDISKNNLSGDIPNELTSLVELRILNLSGNHLTGMIPQNIGNMKQLESLDFSVNSLSGQLPNSFRIMTYMNYLNLSYNKLTGRIPECTQFCSFNESSFIGNNLQGPPLTSSCSSKDADKVPTTKPSMDEEGDKPEIKWLYVFISLGYAVGLSAFLTTLYLKRSWREAYFEILENLWDSVYVYVHIIWKKLKGALHYV